MLTTLIILKLLVKFGVIKPGHILQPQNVMILSKKALKWVKTQYAPKELEPSLVS